MIHRMWGGEKREMVVVVTITGVVDRDFVIAIIVIIPLWANSWEKRRKKGRKEERRVEEREEMWSKVMITRW